MDSLPGDVVADSAASLRAGASARSGAPPSTPAASCALTCSRFRGRMMENQWMSDGICGIEMYRKDHRDNNDHR
ncbi:hypothetical protein C2845_PM11G26610 [Panicum miliaceum]|uniref:Uncharacterized protein n=1 Tax=Panicum miliaceum TaxID=4540 RepID=A0A3L6RPV8_PANMI|nr:hypothetical protein C2845_PM11G26610 [Panicum miliaceum]